MTKEAQSPQLPSAQTGARNALVASLHQPAAIVGIAVIAFLLIASLTSTWIQPYSSTNPSCGVFDPPSAAHWLGCDDGGIDVLSLVLQGGQISMFVGFSAALIAIVVGALVGIVSGYFGGWIETVLMRITDYFLVIPQIVLMIVVAAVWGPSLFHVIVVIGALLWTSTARVIRAQVKTLRERVFIQRVESLGAGHWRTIWRHILPQLVPLLIANAVLAITVAIFNETALAFLGLSDPSAVTWGTIMEHAFERSAISAGAWWAIVPAGLCVGILIMGCYLWGTSIEDALNPRLRISYLSRQSWRLRPLIGFGRDAL